MGPEEWYKDAVIYGIDVELFNDSNGDGVGDFQGLIQKLDYINRLNASAVWLLPFYPTPNRDNGYDVMDYYGVDPRLGTLGDFVEFVDEADARGIKVLIDLVVNHTSDQHPWFQNARTDPDSRYRDYYIWSKERPPPDSTRGTMFPGEVEDGRVWTYDPEAGAYYYHRFYSFQPDLNLANPQVREEIYKIMKFWLELGVAGFRVDAAHLMVQPKHPGCDPSEDHHDVLKGLKRQLVKRRSDGILLAEADDEPQELQSYFGDDEMDLLLNFQLNAHIIASLATEEVAPLVEGLERTPYTPSGTWANFLRNFDELNLRSLASEIREEVFDLFAPEGNMRIYGRGIRRRLAPMLDGNPKRIKLAFSLLFSLPGIPLLLYGDEIGMGEDLSLPGRRSIRTPMQWDERENAGFSTAPADELVTPVVDSGEFGYDRVNVAAQRANPESLLNWIERLVSTRRETHEIGNGPCEIVEVSESSIFCHRYSGEERSILFAHNLAGRASSVTVFLENGGADSVYAILGDPDIDRKDDRTLEVDLHPYGFAWFEVH